MVIDSGDDWATIEYPYPVELWAMDDAPLLTITYPTWALALCGLSPKSTKDIPGGPVSALTGGSEKDFRLRRMRRLLQD